MIDIVDPSDYYSRFIKPIYGEPQKTFTYSDMQKHYTGIQNEVWPIEEEKKPTKRRSWWRSKKRVV